MAGNGLTNYTVTGVCPSFSKTNFEIEITAPTDAETIAKIQGHFMEKSNKLHSRRKNIQNILCRHRRKIWG